jgi:hypothetical protein
MNQVSSYILKKQGRNENMLKMNIQMFAEGEEQTTEEMYLEQINDLKTKMDTMVDPAEYKKLQAQHKKLMDDYVNRRPAPKVEQTVMRPAKEVAKELVSIKNSDITNRDYVAKTLEYREAHIHEFGTDPFTDFGTNGPNQPTDETKNVASTLKTLLDENPSPVDFRIKLNSVLQDDAQLLAKLRKRT